MLEKGVHNILYSIVRVGKRTHTKAHSAVGEDYKKYKCKKNIPLSPQVHTTDIPRDWRAHMDKSVFFS